MRLTDFKAISLGCYGTLIDKEAGVYTALQPLLRDGAVTMSRNDVLATFAVHEAAEMAENPRSTYATLLARVHRRLAAEWYVTVSSDSHALFGMSVAHWPAFVDSAAALQYLRRYFKVMLLSNGDRVGLATSSRRLAMVFDAVLNAQEIGSYKPSHKNFEFLIREVESLGLQRRHLLHAGNSLFHDHEPAAALGIASAWINRRHGKEGWGVTLPSSDMQCYDFHFRSLADLVRAHQETIRA